MIYLTFFHFPLILECLAQQCKVHQLDDKQFVAAQTGTISTKWTFCNEINNSYYSPNIVTAIINNNNNVRFEFISRMLININVLWDIMSCRPVNSFQQTFCLLLQDTQKRAKAYQLTSLHVAEDLIKFEKHVKLSGLYYMKVGNYGCLDTVVGNLQRKRLR